MCNSQFIFVSYIVSLIFGIALWSLAFVGLAHIMHWNQSKTLLWGWVIFIALSFVYSVIMVPKNMEFY